MVPVLLAAKGLSVLGDLPQIPQMADKQLSHESWLDCSLPCSSKPCFHFNSVESRNDCVMLLSHLVLVGQDAFGLLYTPLTE